MASKFDIKMLEQQKAKVLEAQAAIDHKIKEAGERKCKAEAEKAAKKEKREEEKKARLLLKQQAKVEKQPKIPTVGGPSNKSFYPVHQKVMMRLAVELITRMKEDKDPEMYRKFIGLVIQHMSAIDTSIRTITVNDIWQTIRDGSCTYVTGEDEDLDADEVFSPRDIEKMFKEGELMTEVQDKMSRCFESMAEAHSAVKDAYKSAGKLIPKLSTRGMGVLLEALMVGAPTIQDPTLLGILQEARVNRRIREEVKLFGEVSVIRRRKDRQKNRMLPDWNHRVFKDNSKYRLAGKIKAVVAVYLRYAMGEENKDMKLTTVGELYPTGERQVRKVIMGKLYDTEGKRVEQIFTKTGRACEGDPIDWNKEVKEAGYIVPENIVYEVTNKEGPDADLPLPGVQVKAKDIQLVEATVPKMKYFPRLPGQSPQLIVRVTTNKDDNFFKQLVQQVATSEARAEIYKQLGVEPTITERTEGETSSEVIDKTISEESGPLATRLLGVVIKEEVVDKEYIPYKTQKMTKALTGKLIQTKKTIHKKAEVEADVVDLCSSDEEMEDVSGVSTTAVKQEEGDDDDEDDSDDDAEYTGESSEHSSDDEFGVAGLKEIYEEHFGGNEEQQMDTTEETKGPEGLK